MTDLTHIDNLWMGRALSLAKKAADQGEVPVGAILVVDGKAVATAFNKKEQWKTPIGHAELLCVHKASQKLGRWRLADATLYVTLEPCAMCAGALIQARIGRIVFGALDPKGGAIHSMYNIGVDQKLNHTFTVSAGVRGEECGAILSSFFRAQRERKKKPSSNAGLL